MCQVSNFLLKAINVSQYFFVCKIMHFMPLLHFYTQKKHLKKKTADVKVSTSWTLYCLVCNYKVLLYNKIGMIYIMFFKRLVFCYFYSYHILVAAVTIDKHFRQV